MGFLSDDGHSRRRASEVISKPAVEGNFKGSPALLGKSAVRLQDTARRRAVFSRPIAHLPVRSKYSNVLKPWMMTLHAPNGLGKTLLDNSGPCNVVLRLFRMFSLGQRVQPATMIEFKEIEYFDHTGRGTVGKQPSGILFGRPCVQRTGVYSFSTTSSQIKEMPTIGQESWMAVPCGRPVGYAPRWENDDGRHGYAR